MAYQYRRGPGDDDYQHGSRRGGGERFRDEARPWARDAELRRRQDEDRDDRDASAANGERPNGERSWRDQGDGAYERGARGYDSDRFFREPRSRGFAGRGPKGYQRSDERIKEDLSERLMDDDDVDASEITIEVHEGEIVLNGTVGDRRQKRRAEDIAENISGVSQVTNNLRLSRQEHGQASYGQTRSGAQSSSSLASGPSEASKPTNSAL